MKIDGGCHCGGITYTADVDPARVVVCHCTDCQTISGAPYRVNVPVKTEDFHLRGAPTLYTKTGDSGRAVETAFCPNCGSALFSRPVASAAYVNLRVGGVRQRLQLPPLAQGFCRSALPWATDIRGVKTLPER